MTGAGDVLVIGFGNPGRLDDGLGPALARRIEALRIPGVTVEADYQLTVEDAADVAKHETVVFADADVNGPEPFSMRRIYPRASRLSFSSHSVAPEAVLTLARELFKAEPRGYLLGIRGYAFDEFGERLSEKAKANLEAAAGFLESALRGREFTEVRSGAWSGRSRAIDTKEEDEICKTENT